MGGTELMVFVVVGWHRSTLKPSKMWVFTDRKAADNQASLMRNVDSLFFDRVTIHELDLSTPIEVLDIGHDV